MYVLTQLVPQAVEVDPKQAHTPPVHCLLEGQTVPQVPQLASSRPRFVHWPLHSLGLPGGHAHTPPLQSAPVEQTFPQLPQFELSFARFTQPGPSQYSCVEFEQMHSPSTQNCADGHAWLQVPQLAALLERSTQPWPGQ
jgi:hypothetical protein